MVHSRVKRNSERRLVVRSGTVAQYLSPIFGRLKYAGNQEKLGRFMTLSASYTGGLDDYNKLFDADATIKRLPARPTLPDVARYRVGPSRDGAYAFIAVSCCEAWLE